MRRSSRLDVARLYVVGRSFEPHSNRQGVRGIDEPRSAKNHPTASDPPISQRVRGIDEPTGNHTPAKASDPPHHKESDVHVPIPATADLDPEYGKRLREHAARYGYPDAPALFRAYGVVDELGPAMLAVSGVHRRRFPFGDRAREAVVLVTANALGSEYELSIHRHEAMRVGLTAGEVGALLGPVPLTAASLHPLERACVEVAVEVAAGRAAPPDAIALLGEHGFVAVAALISHYRGLAAFAAILDLPPEEFEPDSR